MRVFRISDINAYFYKYVLTWFLLDFKAKKLNFGYYDTPTYLLYYLNLPPQLRKDLGMYVPTTSLFYSNNAISRLSNQIVGCTRCNMHAYAAVKLVKWCDCVSANSRAFIPDFPQSHYYLLQ